MPEGRIDAAVAALDEAAVPDGLTCVSDRMPGIARRRAGKGFAYRGPGGRAIGARDRDRIRALAIPPAWRDVWICPVANGHLQATGIDGKGRKQYRYHADWSGWRARTKYDQLAAFGMALGRLRRAIDRDLGQGAGDRAFAIGAILLLIDRAMLRVGTEAYAAENRTFGATTLLRRHLSVTDRGVRLAFRAKGGKAVRQVLGDRRLNRILTAIADLPGRRLFTWLDAEGTPRAVTSQDVNARIAEATGLPGATAKTFRTWGGTLAAFEAALAAEGRLTARALAEAASDRLANTPAIARASYIHPRVLALAEVEPADRAALLAALTPAEAPGLRGAEGRLLTFLADAA